MNRFEPTRPVESPSETLYRLEVATIWMWSSEPACSVDERAELMERLGAVSTTVERLVFRHESEPDHPVDLDDLRECVIELDALSARWTDLATDLAVTQ